ncbi:MULTISPECIES: hypothetical protein [Paenibacillus]|jgi:hypothetical protein|uniref:hypothetical protein n=1 Tax=Paenibacillus TaxID=44249 RepID=UPI0011A3F75E|nr:MULTISPECIES: hypothetical protein [Paenibacillus]MCI1777701.1 hypothetical protein [Paenibacillus lautus]WFB57640.1 hypothetical protein P0X86_27345 [Paenibacillus sp. BR1-192]
MLRSDLVKQALEAGRNAEHNLQVIVRNPDKMIDSNKLVNGIAYLNNMIRFAEKELEMKKDRRPGQSRLRSRLMSLLSSILIVERQKRKGVEL